MNTLSLPSNGIVVTETEVLESWLDYNDHMNVAYYVAAFDLGIDAFKATLGIDLDYIAREKRSTVALEAHIGVHPSPTTYGIDRDDDQNPVVVSLKQAPIGSVTF